MDLLGKGVFRSVERIYLKKIDIMNFAHRGILCRPYGTSRRIGPVPPLKQWATLYRPFRDFSCLCCLLCGLCAVDARRRDVLLIKYLRLGFNSAKKKWATGIRKISLPPFARRYCFFIRRLLFEIFECRVICAGELHNVPSGFQLEVKLRLPRLHQNL